MKQIAQILVVISALSAVYETSSALIVLEGMTKEGAESVLGVVMRREFIGSIGSVTNEAGISIEFAPKGDLQGFLFLQLDVYLELPTESGHGSANSRRLTSVTLPLTRTEDKVSVFFAVDQEYLDKTYVTIRVRRSGGTGPYVTHCMFVARSSHAHRPFITHSSPAAACESLHRSPPISSHR